MTSDGTRTFEWDEENRLVSVTIGTHRSEYVYDGLGRRVQILEKEIQPDQSTTTSSDKKYLWVGTAIAEERAGADGGTVVKKFFSQGFIDSDGTKLLYTTDHLGSIRELVDMAQNVRARYDYDPWGRATKILGDKDSVFLYTGHFWHAQSGLYLALFRAYDPNLGRWLSRDPLEEDGGINLYAYVENDPVSLIDPLGLYWSDPINGVDWLQNAADYAAGFGDNLSFGLTQKIRELMGIDDLVNKCSTAYKAGDWSAIAWSIAFGGAHLGRNALYQMGKGGFKKGLLRLLSDKRSWGSVRSTWSRAAGAGKPWLKANGQSLHHWLVPQRFGQINAGFNYMPISAGFNSWMNGSSGLRVAVEWGFRGSVIGAYGAPIHSAFGGDE